MAIPIILGVTLGIPALWIVGVVLGALPALLLLLLLLIALIPA